jgi:hypothetical protein
LQYQYKDIDHAVHRLIPSRFPPVLLFDWAESPEELEQIAALEGMTNDRLLTECGALALVSREDWVGGPGSSPLMAAFTHPAASRFSDGSFGIYYAGDSLETSIEETKFHRERFLKASNEPPCLIQMREYIANLKKPLIDISGPEFNPLLDPDINHYPRSQDFGIAIKTAQEWGLYYPSVRRKAGNCVAVFRGPALSIPIQASHLDYVWDGVKISSIRKAVI